MILFQRRMVVHVIVAEIGETAGREPDTIQTALVEAVAGSLHGRMRHTHIRKLGQQRVERDGVRCGQRPVFDAAGRHDARRANAGSGQSSPGPNLAREGGDRGLAAGAGDRHHRCRLPSVEERRELRQGEPRIVDFDHRQAGSGGLGASRHDYRRRSPGDRVVHVARPVILAALEGGEQEARLDTARVRSDADDLDLARAGIGKRQNWRKGLKLHVYPVISNEWLPFSPGAAESLA
jgi:hypothetical protein